MHLNDRGIWKPDESIDCLGYYDYPRGDSDHDEEEEAEKVVFDPDGHLKYVSVEFEVSKDPILYYHATVIHPRMFAVECWFFFGGGGEGCGGGLLLLLWVVVVVLLLCCCCLAVAVIAVVVLAPYLLLLSPISLGCAARSRHCFNLSPFHHPSADTGEDFDALTTMTHAKLVFLDREWSLVRGDDDYAWPEGSELVPGQYDGPADKLPSYMIDVGQDGRVVTVSGDASYVDRIIGRVTDVQVSDDGSVTVTMTYEEMYNEEFDVSVAEGEEDGEQTIVFAAGCATCTSGGIDYTKHSTGS